MNYVVDRREAYDIGWAIGPNARAELQDAIDLAREMAMSSGEAYHVFKLVTKVKGGERNSRWVRMAKVMPDGLAKWPWEP